MEPVSTSLVRPRFLRRPRSKRADGRCSVTFDIHPVLAGLVDEAAELLADRLGRRLDRSAYYEALLAAGLRSLGSVERELAADPDGVGITSRLVRELESAGGLAAALAGTGHPLGRESPEDGHQGGPRHGEVGTPPG